MSRAPATERVNPQTRHLDALSAGALVELLVRQQRAAFDAVEHAAPVIAAAVDRIAGLLREGGTLHYVGAGSSGRIATLDAAECPPTFGTDPSLVRAHVAGGETALRSAIEGAEDDAGAGAAIASRFVNAGDAVIGLSASGGAPFVVAALRASREIGAFTLALVADGRSELAHSAEVTVVLETGPEAIAGSTRLAAGTAQKLALNAISTAVMVRLGKVYDNLMVDVRATNAKLRRRALALVQTLARADETRARELLGEAGGSVKVAVVMAHRGIDAEAARALLEREGGFLRAVIS